MITPRSINEMLERHWPAARCVCTNVGSRHATASLTPGANDLRPGGGPTLFAVADTALWFLCFGATGRLEPLALTSELSIRFLRPARGETVLARAELNRLGRRSVVGTVAIWTEIPDAPNAIAQGTYVLPAGEGLETPKNRSVEVEHAHQDRRDRSPVPLPGEVHGG